MTVDDQESRYDPFYARGGWKYSPWREKRFLLRRIVRPLALTRGQHVLEVGCGVGLHSHLLADLGFDVVGVDSSSAGIAYAREHFRGPRYVQADAAGLESALGPASFDVVFLRGMSWYHYELDGVNKMGVDVPAGTAVLFRVLRPGGVLILQIETDFSGRRPDNGAHQNPLAAYHNLFSRFGRVELVTDWEGQPLPDDVAARASGRNIIIATRAAVGRP